MKTARQKRRHQIIWTTISVIAALGMVVSLILPVFA